MYQETDVNNLVSKRLIFGTLALLNGIPVVAQKANKGNLQQLNPIAVDGNLPEWPNLINISAESGIVVTLPKSQALIFPYRHAEATRALQRKNNNSIGRDAAKLKKI